MLSTLRLEGRLVRMVSSLAWLRGYGLPGCRGSQPKQGLMQLRRALIWLLVLHNNEPFCCPGGKKPSKDVSNCVVCRSEELRLRPQALRKFLDKVRACAADEGAHQLLQRKATEFAAFLRFREKVWTPQCCSCFLLMATEHSGGRAKYGVLLIITRPSSIAVMSRKSSSPAVT